MHSIHLDMSGEKKKKRSTIALAPAYREELKELGKKGESYENIIVKLMLYYKQGDRKKKG